MPAVESSEEPGQGGGGPGGSSARRGAAAGKEGSVPFFFPLRENINPEPYPTV